MYKNMLFGHIHVFYFFMSTLANFCDILIYGISLHPLEHEKNTMQVYNDTHRYMSSGGFLTGLSITSTFKLFLIMK